MKKLTIAAYTYTGYRIVRGVLLFVMLTNKEKIHDAIFRRTYKFLYGKNPQFGPPKVYRIRDYRRPA